MMRPLPSTTTHLWPASRQRVRVPTSAMSCCQARWAPHRSACGPPTQLTTCSRWQELQLRFVDDPRGVVIEARSLVAEAVQSLTAALSDRQRDLDGLASSNGDTEQLRTALQRYRDFFDRWSATAADLLSGVPAAPGDQHGNPCCDWIFDVRLDRG